MNDIKIWTAPTTTKILADKRYKNKDSAKLLFECAKNEYESAQIIITPSKKIKEYSIKLKDVQSLNKEHLITQDCFKIYNQKYIKVTASSKDAEKYGNPLGEYPDALLPFDKAVEYKENNVSKNKNQAIFISLKIPEKQEAGLYEGNFILTVDGEDYKIPVFVEVWDFAITKEVHCQSDFVIGTNGLKMGENDYFPEMYRKYCEKLIEFRLSPHRVMQFLNRPYNEGADFVREVRYFSQPDKPQLSTIVLPVYPHPVTGIDEADFKKHVLSLLNACVEDKINYFEKAVVYCGFIDEPDLNDTFDETNRVCKRFEDMKNETADEFLKTVENNSFNSEIANALREVPNYVTIHFDDRIKEVKHWCPNVVKIASKELREKYHNSTKKHKNWWYQCGNKADSPSYGIDHNLLDARIFSWMTYDYGFGGTIYWETAQYFKWVFCLESHINHEIAIDCYKEPVRCSTDNGDGFLLYPGKNYGIYGPVESIRLHAIRDGFEEYEYLYLYEELCKKVGKDFRSEMQSLFDRLYKDVLVTATSEDFASVRRQLAHKIVAIKKEINNADDYC